MIKRVVKLTISPDHIDDFKAIFNRTRSAIKGYDGCHEVIMGQDNRYPNILFTISDWESQVHLDNYRKSELFNSTWKEVKKLFCGPPEAYSIENVI